MVLLLRNSDCIQNNCHGVFFYQGEDCYDLVTEFYYFHCASTICGFSAHFGTRMPYFEFPIFYFLKQVEEKNTEAGAAG